ncbi:MAG: TRAP transporter small permease [Deltaproteobacteria bacterium]|nr:TRAP transporter small permease [Deltaproteobacteria bacterium]
MLFAEIWKRLMFLMLVVMAFLMTIGALMRYFFNSPIEFADEVSGLLLLGITFLGLAYVEKDNAHIRIELLFKRLNGGMRAVLAKVNWVIEVFWTVIVLVCTSLAVMDFFGTERRSMSTEWLIWPFACVMVLGTIMLLIELVFGKHNPFAFFRGKQVASPESAQEVAK